MFVGFFFVQSSITAVTNTLISILTLHYHLKGNEGKASSKCRFVIF